MLFKSLILTGALSTPILAQTSIYDFFTTTWDRASLFTYKNLGSSPLTWSTGVTAGSAVINVNGGTVYQTMDGFGATLTDSSAELMYNMKVANAQNYWDLLGYLFDITDGALSAGFSSLRVPIGASDFSASAYNWDSTSGDTALSSFSVASTPSYVWTVLTDIIGIQPSIKLYVLPWSPPGWMKSSGSMDGGTLNSAYYTVYANYLLKAVQAFKTKGWTPYALSLQNEPLNSDGTYPTSLLPSAVAATIGTTVRTLLNNNGLSTVKIIGYEHNWDNTTYPEDVLSKAGSSFAGVSWHCYAGANTAMTTVHNAYPNAEVHFTECSGTLGSDWWSDIKWDVNTLVNGGPNNWARTVMTWALALDASGDPKLPGTDSCGGAGCRGVVTIANNAWTVNQEFYSMAQGSRAILPKDAGGPWGQRISTTVTGSLAAELVVTGYVTKRLASTDWPRYSLVVLNWNDGGTAGWNPQPVAATINFNGVTASYTFPVGVTTLWWFNST
ncbi:hypothetical protein FRB94_004503 [Tulasnella sp. JGI-2019a]|nr:hypothetical protein FRB93_013811 [Tulasnella sp. JGI-2019a]KAG9001850.1 hypothetical protein FRB94_004503 [Tulasnella sp. JGI-2019a]KAG9037045.1 hypothetical protein FRB95_006898 [Tulasnella sp. JGI-2019a]